MNLSKSLILASGSPRRRELLTTLGVPFEVLASDTDESFPSEMPVRDVPVLLAERKAVAVLCPRSNAFLGNGVPPLALLLGSGVAIAFGTDSLASCPSLDVLEDARLLARKFPRVPKAALLHGLTRGGAFALGLSHFFVKSETVSSNLPQPNIHYVNMQVWEILTII